MVQCYSIFFLLIHIHTACGICRMFHAIYEIGYLIPFKLIKLSFGHFFPLETGNEKLYAAIGYAHFVSLFYCGCGYGIVFGKMNL